jgi:heparan-alpha-glucosaminide N-acetyltransferase
MNTLPLDTRERVYSVDILRGMTIFLMVLVNELAGVKGTPGWLEHFPPKGDGMTIVDVVFPAFIFVMGMSIPLSLGQRRDGGKSWFTVLPHILIRTFSLLLIGILMVNSPNDARIGWPRGVWTLLMYLSPMLVFYSTITPSVTTRRINDAIRLIGLILIVVVAFSFRDARGHWLRHSWYGILGLIGFAYVIAAVIYLIFRENRTALVGSMGLLYCVFIAFHEGLLKSSWVSQPGLVGSQPAVAVAGVFLGTLLVGNESLRDKVRVTLALAGFSAAAAWLLRPLYGISKNAATPSWCLYSVAIAAVLWLVLYYIADVRKRNRILAPFRIFGINPLFAYLLAPLLTSAFRVFGMRFYGQLGRMGFSIGFARSFVFTLIVAAITIVVTRVGFRLKL